MGTVNASENLEQYLEKIKEIEKIGLTNDWNLSRIAPCKIELNNGEKFEFTTIKWSEIETKQTTFKYVNQLFL